MNTLMPIHSKFNLYSCVKLSLITLVLSLLTGGYTRANAESAPKVEVISVPPQEAFYVEQKTPVASSGYKSSSVDSKISNTRTALPGVANNCKNEQNHINNVKYQNATAAKI